MLGPSFFYHVLRPGRYLGGEAGIVAGRDGRASRTVAWFYPDRYEFAMADAGWRRGYFQAVGLKGVRCSRAVEYAADVWRHLSQQALPPFALGGTDDLRRADAIVFWVPDLFRAAHIPGIVRMLRFEDKRPEIGAVVDGLWAPRFLLENIDWIAPAPGGWLPDSLAAYLTGGGALPDSVCSGRDEAGSERFWSGCWSPGKFLPAGWVRTPRWVANVDVGDDHADVDLAGVDDAGRLRPREIDALIIDALEGLHVTGIDGIRFCGSGFDQSAQVALVMAELARRHNMKRVRAHWPAMTCGAFVEHWRAYKPHLLKPILRLLIDAQTDPEQAGEIGRQALNAGWHGLSAVLSFDSFSQLSAMIPRVREIIESWNSASEGFTDKRPLRLEYRPAPIDRWLDPPSEPSEDDLRRFAGEFRHLKDDLSRCASVGTFRIEEVMARNWLAAAPNDLWSRLALLELSDPNDEEAPPFDWFGWVRQRSGLDRPPSTSCLHLTLPPCSASAAETSPPLSPSLSTLGLDLPAENLFGRRPRKARFTRRLAAPSCTRMRVRWGRDVTWRLYSHLDVVRAIERAVRRSSIPAAYSEGFHPRLKLSFGPPLPFGLISSAEYLDLILEEDFQPTLAERLAQALPAGIDMSEARGLAAGVPSLTDMINEAAFCAILPLDLGAAEERLAEFRQRPEIHWTRPDRPGRKPIDPRRSLLGTSVEQTSAGTQWNLSVRLGAEGNLRATDWAVLLFGLTPDQIAELIIERTALLIRQGTSVRTPLDPL